MKLKGRDPGGGGARGKSMSKAKGNAIPPKALRGGGVDDTGGSAVANQLTRLSKDERPPHSSMNADRNPEDVFQPGDRRMNAEQGRPLAAGRTEIRRNKGLRGKRGFARS